MRFKFKQVLVVRGDLKMSPGKLAAQVAHGAVTAAENTRKRKPEIYRGWLAEGQKKVVLLAEDEEELKGLKERAEREGLEASLVVDAGLTELPPGTVTVLAIGPDYSERIDRVTGHLPLYK